MPSIYSFTTTVQDIIDDVSKDVRLELSSDSSEPTEQGILIDYTNRTSADLLRSSRWRFLRGVFFFTTRKGQPEYWFGPTGSTPATAIDLGLNLNDVRSVTQVWDYTNFRKLDNTYKTPNLPAFQAPEHGTPR